MSMPERVPAVEGRASRIRLDGWGDGRRYLGFALMHATMKDDYIKEAQKVITDPNVLINVVSRRVKQLRRGSRPLVESLEKLAPEDVALREIIEGKISFEAGEN
ncbi:MAG TPA: DNA-directed RNA polymerase subunit omega [Opitutaceae bacterium]|nr:DNA-directed RNA polymerase subunit omega [Opitutaceae bacterium]